MKAICTAFFFIMATTTIFAADTWVFLGDSLTVGTIGNGEAFKAEIKAAYGVEINVHNTSRVGKHVTEYVKEIDTILKKYPQAKYFPFMIGTNDVLHYSHQQGKWLRRHLVTVLEKIKRAGRTPILLRIPFRRHSSGDPLAAFNTHVYDPLIQQYSKAWYDEQNKKGLLDMHSFLKTKPSYVASDGIHMTSTGYKKARQTIFVGLMAKVVYGDGRASVTPTSSSDLGLLNQNANTVMTNQHLEDYGKATSIERLMSSVLQAQRREDGIYALCELEAALQSAEGGTLTSHSAEIKTFQLLTSALGYDCGEADGIYGPKTRAGGQKLRIALTQVYLSALGFSPGPIDGIVGPLTQSAMESCARAGGPSANGAVDQTYLTELRKRYNKGSVI